MIGMTADAAAENCATWKGARPLFPGHSFSMGSLQICVHQVDEVLGKLGGNLFLGTVSEVKTDMGFEDLAHEGVDAAADSGKQHELAAAIFIGGERTLDGVELTADFSESLQQLQLLAFLMGHGLPPCFDYTNRGYSINPAGV